MLRIANFFSFFECSFLERRWQKKLTISDLKRPIQDAELSSCEIDAKRDLVEYYLAKTTGNPSTATVVIEPTATVEELATVLKLSASALQTLKDEELKTVDNVRILVDARNFPENLTFKQADKLKLVEFLRLNHGKENIIATNSNGKRTADLRVVLDNQAILDDLESERTI